ncbi:MAG: hypothetical protein A3G75_03985 [Verrucomicrobia bacterium RIFCSPLOWO2_12_FULL_64_8]|nr:MAG: hypothetical protein A3G75_03985 [Verrucomicrobia bacterium RIFCSPLOWO2_12_FULL_64_8]
MNRAYIIFPVAGLLVFGAFFWNFNRGFEAKADARRKADIEARNELARQEVKKREEAYKAALEAQARRAEERRLKQEKEEKEKAAFQAMIDDRDRAHDEVNKRLRPQLERVKKDLEVVKEEVAKLEFDKEQYLKEQRFLNEYIRNVQANSKSYAEALDKIAALEKKRVDAERAVATVAASRKT